ncbi:hypothetical protein J6590_015551 [Homalodisca vitripennis]|nr:hypothetical protein J6590_015551 [Homalodisca vitripennis]
MALVTSPLYNFDEVSDNPDSHALCLIVACRPVCPITGGIMSAHCYPFLAFSFGTHTSCIQLIRCSHFSDLASTIHATLEPVMPD